MLKLKLQNFAHLIQRADSFEKTLMLINIKGRRRRAWQRKRRLDSIIDSMDMSLSKLREIVKDREAQCAAIQGVTKCWTWLSNWTTTKCQIWAFVEQHTQRKSWSKSKMFIWSLKHASKKQVWFVDGKILQTEYFCHGRNSMALEVICNWGIQISEEINNYHK